MFRKFFLLVASAAAVTGSVFFAPSAHAAADLIYCFCSDDLSTIDTSLGGDTNKVIDANFSYQARGCDAAISSDDECSDEKIRKPDGQPYTAGCHRVTGQQKCLDEKDTWTAARAKRLSNAQETAGGLEGIAGNAVPACLKQDRLSQTCRDIGVFIALFINWGKGSFGIVGSFALAYFIYGGFILILSQGNPEKVKKGTDTMLAAIIGIFVMFAGYMLIRFLAQAVGVQSQFILR